MTPRTIVGSCVYLQNKIYAIPHVNSGRIETSRLSACSSRLTRVSSSIGVNLWPLARVSARGCLPQRRARRVASDTQNTPAARVFEWIFLFLYAEMAICIRDSLDKGILYKKEEEMAH